MTNTAADEIIARFAEKQAARKQDAVLSRIDTTTVYRNHSDVLAEAYASLTRTGWAKRADSVARQYLAARDAEQDAKLPGSFGDIANPSPALVAVHDTLLKMTLTLADYADAARPDETAETISAGQEAAYGKLKQLGGKMCAELKNVVEPNLAEAMSQLNEHQQETLRFMIGRATFVSTQLAAQDRARGESALCA